MSFVPFFANPMLPWSSVFTRAAGLEHISDRDSGATDSSGPVRGCGAMPRYLVAAT